MTEMIPQNMPASTMGPVSQAPVTPMVISGPRPTQAEPPTAIQGEDLFLSPAAGRLRQIERQLGYRLESVSRPAILAGRIQRLMDERSGRRMAIEEEWLEAYRRYNGEYSGSVRARLMAQPNRSHLWVGLTRMKTDAAHSDIMDILRGNGNDRPWGMQPERINENFPIPPDLEMIGVSREMINDENAMRTRGMEQEVGGQLDVSDFDEALDTAVLESRITGTSWIKGPFTVPDKRTTWATILDINRKARADPQVASGYRPAVKHVSCTNVYPDMECPNHQDGDIIEEMPLSRRQFMDLIDQPGIKPATVLRVLRETPDGNYTPKPHMMELRRIGQDARPSTSNLFSLLCFYGEVTGSELREAGEEVPDALLHVSVTAEIWSCGQYILRARQHEGPKPYHPVRCRPRGVPSPFGIGIPMTVNHSQDAINGAARQIMDNMAIASGPIMELNMNLVRLQPGQDPTDIHGWKVYMSHHDGASGKSAIKMHEIQAYSQQFIQVIDLFRRFLDEESGQPSLTSGMQGMGTTRTATGMSILNTNANKSRNHAVRYIDDSLIEPLIEAMYDWNMRYSIKEWILAPARIIARGAQSLMAKEIESQRLLSVIQLALGHPHFRDDPAFRQMFRQMGLPVDELWATPEEAAQEQQAAQGAQGGENIPSPQATPMPGAPPVGNQPGGMLAA